MDRNSRRRAYGASTRQVSLRPVAGYPSSSRLLVNGILGQTSSLVRHALGGDWRGVVVAAERRRELLGRLEEQCFPQEAADVTALRQAVEESEQALALIESCPLVPQPVHMLR